MMRIKDNSSKLKEEFTGISNIVNKIANKTLSQLSKDGIFVFPSSIDDSEDVTGKQMVLQAYDNSFRTSNVMGFLGLGDERLIIESRFSKGDDDFFFQFLLEKVMDIPNILDMKTDASQDLQLFNLLLFLFPQYLKNAVRKGIFKTYIRKEYNDENMRGTINIPKHIQKNIPFIGKIAYSQREFTNDNYLIELIRHTLEFIKRKPYGNKILEPIKDEVKLVIEITGNYKPSDRLDIIEKNKKNIVRHAYYHEYGALQRLCILILQNEKHNMGTGSNRVFGILFDGAWLWEEYVNTLITEYYYHPMNKGGTGAQWLFDGSTGLIYPDFISRNPNKRIIADAKYKPISNIGNKDYLQLLAYMLRFDSEKAFYLYPESGNENDLELVLNKGVSFEKNVSPRDNFRLIKHGFKIPEASKNYVEFSEAMQHSEKEFIEKLMD